MARTSMCCFRTSDTIAAGSAAPIFIFELITLRRGPGPGLAPPNTRGTNRTNKVTQMIAATPVGHHRRVTAMTTRETTDRSATYGVNETSVLRYHVRSRPNTRMTANAPNAATSSQHATVIDVRTICCDSDAVGADVSP